MNSITPSTQSPTPVPSPGFRCPPCGGEGFRTDPSSLPAGRSSHRPCTVRTTGRSACLIDTEKMVHLLARRTRVRRLLRLCAAAKVAAAATDVSALGVTATTGVTTWGV